MNANPHFEFLWNLSESLFTTDIASTSVASILTELHGKISLYGALDNNTSISTEEKQKLKSHMFGKILACLTQLSLKDEINSYTALQNAIEDVKAEQLGAKYR